MEPRTILRIEGLAVFGGALAAYAWLGGPLWLLLVLALAPDLSTFGYLAGPRIGSHAYNAVHTYVLPIVLGGVGVQVDSTIAVQVAVVWIGHVGADRLFGYRLKLPTGFKDTHLGNFQPAPDLVVDRDDAE